MKVFQQSTLLLALAVQHVFAASTRGGSHKEQPSSRDIAKVKNPCSYAKCSFSTPVCVINSAGFSQCVEDVCSDQSCDEGYQCFPKVVQCFRAPCPPIIECKPLPGNPITSCSDLICNAASTCEINEKGEAYCKPLPGNPGNTDKPKWWNQIKKSFKGKGLDQCSEQRGIAPGQGSKCTSKKGGKTCFFGNQECKVIGSFPNTRCDCIKGKWKCNKKLKCLTSKNETFV
jgi:hypothetical protein